MNSWAGVGLWSLATRYGGIARWLIMMHGLNLGVVWYWVTVNT